MNIKILDSWIRDFLKTEAKPHDFARQMSLTSVSIERIEPRGADFVYDIEITTNRPDLMSVVNIAREASAVLPQEEFKASFIEPKYREINNKAKLELEIVNDSKLVNRICAVALEIKMGKSPSEISERLEASDIRSLNNAVDVTNYVMREVGHPMHVFDYDKLLKTGKLIVRESKKGEQVITLDQKVHTLLGGDIVADNGRGDIIDLLGVMGTLNSAVDDNTKRVLLFVDNNDKDKIRKTSMSLGIRSEAAILNEKGLDPELALNALLRGVELLEKIADGKVISELVDIYPNRIEAKTVSITQMKINSLIGVDIKLSDAAEILGKLGFQTKINDQTIDVQVPSWRLDDVSIPEDLGEEIARIYGYHRLPTVLPESVAPAPYNRATDPFYFEARVRSSLKHWGFTEIYTMPMVSEDLLEVAPTEAVTIKNPLTDDHVYMKTTLVPSLLAAERENKNRERLQLFEIANIYIKQPNDLPNEKLKLAGIYKKPKATFFEVKGIIEALLSDLGIKNIDFLPGESGATMFIKKDELGTIEILEDNLVDFELDFETILKHASLKKTYIPASKFPESIEDLRFEIDEKVPYADIVAKIREQSSIVKRVELLDVYKNKKTFRIIYQSQDRNLTGEDLTTVREKIISILKKSFKALPA